MLLLSYCPWGLLWARFTQQMFSALCPGVWLCSTTARPEADGSSSGSCLLGAAGTSGFLGELQDRGGGIGRVALVVFPGKGRKALLAVWGGAFLGSVLLAGSACSEGEQSALLCLGCAS